MGDGIGFTDVSLVLRACTSTSGTLLQPSRPATSIDANFFQAAFGGEVGPVPNKSKVYPVWSSHTVIPVCSGEIGASKCVPTMWGHVFAVNLAAPFSVVPTHLPLDTDVQVEMIQWTGYGPANNISVSTRDRCRPPQPVTAATHVSSCVFSLYTRLLATISTGGWRIQFKQAHRTPCVRRT